VYAVNVSDLIKLKVNSLHPVNMLLIPMLTDTIINCEPGQADGNAVLVSDAANERWPVLVHVIRRGSGCYSGIRKRRLRIYCKKGNGWEQM
jgi:hypothetical protein